MAFGVCSYPILEDRDLNFIQDFRKENDELYYSVAKPHFAFVFPIEDDEFKKDHFVDEICDKTRGVEQIDFEIGCATINKDFFLDYYHLLLVPDKGFSKIVKLHDKLYSNLLFSFLRLDIDFIPHIGVANSRDKFEVKKWVDQWNQNEFSIKGTIDALTVVDYSNNVLTDLEKIELK